MRFTRFTTAMVTIALATTATAQYSSDFESVAASAGGTVLTGQDAYYIPGGTVSTDFNAFTYAGNSLGLPANPDGGAQFVAGTGPGTLPAGATFARAQRDVTYGAGTGIWTAAFDICATFTGTLPTAQNLGSFSTQTFPGGQTFIALATWTDVNTATNWNADYVWFDAAGNQLTESVADPAFQSLAANTWYRWETDFDLDTNRIVEVRITDIVAATTATNNPVDRYMFGGAAGAPSPTGFRFFAGSATVPGNTLAFDNASLEEVPPPPSTIYGLDFRMDRFFTSDTGSFVTNFTAIGAPNAESVFALDFDATASTLWGVNNTTNEYGTFDLATGVWTGIGPVTGGSVGATGLTAAADGETWYLSEFDGTNSNLYVGDVTCGSFSFVGIIVAGIIIDISIDSQGNLYGNNIGDDSLYSIDTGSGLGTLIGPTGQPANFAQGMDFDWSTDTLYATVYTGGGTGVFATFDLGTGFANVIESTTPLNAEMEIAVRQGSLQALGSIYCSPAVANSTGLAGAIRAVGSDDVDDNDLTLFVSCLPPGAFGYFICGPDTGTNMPLASQGVFCLAGGDPTLIGRFNSVDRIFTASASGGASLTVDLDAIPIAGGPDPMAPVSRMMQPGDSWNFQAWYRDGTENNFTDAVTISFLP